MTGEKCGAIGALTVGGRVVGSIRCDRRAGHEQRATCGGSLLMGRCLHVGADGVGYHGPDLAHSATLEWTPEETPDLDIFDPDETFDVDVPLSPSAPEDVPSVEPESWADLFRRAAGPKRAPMYGSSDDDGI